MGRTRHALHALLKLRPARALVRRANREQEVEVEAVQVGETVIVKPGESFPVDGTVTLGESLVDQSTLTGESVPVAKAIGDKVFAGTLNQQGSLEYIATRAAANSALARIVALVEEAQSKKSRAEELAEVAGRYYTIIVMVAAGLMLLIPPLFMGVEWRPALYRAMTLLVVASPCALVIATPATVLSAIANAARNGILFKGGADLEALGRVRLVAFDKTGTLTHGRFEVTDLVAVQGADDSTLLAWAAAAEKRSPHPLAQAVVRAAEVRGVAFTPAESLTNHLGKGLVAMVGGARIEVGTPDLFRSLDVAVPEAALELGHAFYNMTWYGNARVVFDGTHQQTRDTAPAARDASATTRDTTVDEAPLSSRHRSGFHSERPLRTSSASFDELEGQLADPLIGVVVAVCCACRASRCACFACATPARNGWRSVRGIPNALSCRIATTSWSITSRASPTIACVACTCLSRSRGSFVAWMITLPDGIGGENEPCVKLHPIPRMTSLSRSAYAAAWVIESPPAPAARRWFSGKAPFPESVVTTGASKSSASSTRELVASAQSTP